MPVRAVAKVRVTIEIHLTQPWLGSTTIEEAHRVAKADAEREVRALKGITVVGEPSVTLVSFEGEP